MGMYIAISILCWCKT